MAGTKTKKETVATVTSIEELKQYSNGTVVELPCFAEGQPFVARFQRGCRTMKNLITQNRENKRKNQNITIISKIFTKRMEGKYGS